jgi:phospholipase/carboxylesterase
MSDELLERIEREPSTDVRASVIWLHGLGDTGDGWSMVDSELGVQDELGARFIFPHAPRRSVTINAGMVMPAWYDIRRLDARYFEDEDDEGIHESDSRMRAFVENEIERGVPVGKIVVAGFSQGGAIALQTGLRYPERLAGVLALSTCLSLAGTVESERSEANLDVPIFVAHGTVDPVIPIAAAEASRAKLEELGYAVTWRTYPMEHAFCAQEAVDVAGWLREVLA